MASQVPAASASSRRRILAVLGAAVADAAAMPVHWVYDVARVEQVASEHNKGDFAFIPQDASGTYHAGVPAYFAHSTLETGDTTYYTELGLVLARSLIEKGDLDVEDFQTKVLATFGPGGAYTGYMPSVLKAFIAKMTAEGGPAKVGPLSGTTEHGDSTILGTLVILAARFAGSAELDAKTEAVVRTLVNTDDAVVVSLALVRSLAAAIAGTDLGSAISEGLSSATASSEAITLATGAVEDAKSASGELAAISKKYTPACDLKMSVPLALFAVSSTVPPHFATAVRTNVALSGDNCGRAPIVGALAAAGSDPGDSVDWLAWAGKLGNVEEVTRLANALALAAEA